jgi:hypothetical protein
MRGHDFFFELAMVPGFQFSYNHRVQALLGVLGAQTSVHYP